MVNQHIHVCPGFKLSLPIVNRREGCYDQEWTGDAKFLSNRKHQENANKGGVRQCGRRHTKTGFPLHRLIKCCNEAHNFTITCTKHMYSDICATLGPGALGSVHESVHWPGTSCLLTVQTCWSHICVMHVLLSLITKKEKKEKKGPGGPIAPVCS